MEEECPLCREPLSTGPHTKMTHPMNGVCTGFNIHVTCRVSYVHSHLTKGTNLVCTTCNLHLAPRTRANVPVNTTVLLCDLFLTTVGAVTAFNIVVIGGSIEDYLHFGVAIIYASMRHAPYLIRRNVGGTGKRKRGGTRLKPNEVAVITIRNPTEEILRKVERMTGNPRKIISLE